MSAPSAPRNRLTATVRAHANIALAKYWGKADIAKNLPAVPSLSLTLNGMRTITEVTFAPELEKDELFLGGRAEPGKPLARASKLLAEVRAIAGVQTCARVRSHILTLAHRQTRECLRKDICDRLPARTWA